MEATPCTHYHELFINFKSSSPSSLCVLRCLTLLILAGADVNAKEEFTTPFKMAQKKHMRSFDGTCYFFFKFGIEFCGLR